MTVILNNRLVVFIKLKFYCKTWTKKGWEELDVNEKTKEGPRSLGLKDGSMIAFRFSSGEGKGKGKQPASQKFHVEFSSYDDNYD